MKANFMIGGGRLNFELDAGSAKELFEQLAEVQTTFDVEHQCGLCGSDHVQFNVREEEGKGKQKGQLFRFYELRCQGILENGDPCRARFDFGQSMDTKNLFPKRKDDEGNVKGKRGWYRYVPQDQQRDDQPQGRAPEPAPISQPRTAPRPALHANAGTPDGLQPSFDRLAELFQWRTAPTQLGSALDQLRGEFGMKAGQMGTDRFDKIYRAYEASTGKGTTAAVKALMKDCVTALDELPARAIA